jgi:hypothetical protein
MSPCIAACSAAILPRCESYAYDHGATLVASAGDDAIDFDRTVNRLKLPAMSPHVIAVSALAPEGWCVNPNTDLDVKASYSNFGRSVIDFAAPGGDYDFPYTFPCTVMTAAGPRTLPVFALTKSSRRDFQGLARSSACRAATSRWSATAAREVLLAAGPPRPTERLLKGQRAPATCPLPKPRCSPRSVTNGIRRRRRGGHATRCLWRSHISHSQDRYRRFTGRDNCRGRSYVLLAHGLRVSSPRSG